MADLTQTAANVSIAANSNLGRGTAGAAITAGMPIYEDATDSNKLKPARASSAAEAAVKGIAVCDAASGQPVLYAQPGQTLDVGGTLVLGTLYVVSNTAGGGKIAPDADIASGWFATFLGIPISTSQLKFQPVAGGVATP